MPSPISRIACITLFALSANAFAADPALKLQQQGAGEYEVKEGDKLPDEYKRDTMAVKDWKAHNLSAPGENEQWVKIKDKYVLVNIPNGTAKQMVDKPAAKKQ